MAADHTGTDLDNIIEIKDIRPLSRGRRGRLLAVKKLPRKLDTPAIEAFASALVDDLAEARAETDPDHA